MDKLDATIFYKLERAIRLYRQFAQRRIRKAGHKITIDQWLTMKNIYENPGITQQELAAKIFKDNASVTRIIELLVKAGSLRRTANLDDRRRSNLNVTARGSEVMERVSVVIRQNRSTALRGIDAAEIEMIDSFLNKITENCQNGVE